MKILVVNAGSSSLKYQLIEMDTESVLAKGVCERIGLEGSVLVHKGKKEARIEGAMPTHQEAIQMVLDALVSKEYGVIDDMSEIAAVGHRVVHGAETFTESVKCAGGRNPLLMGGHYQGAASTSSPAKNFTPTVKTLDVVSTDKDYTLTVNGGTWRSIKGGNWRHAGGAHIGSIDGNVTVNIGKNAVVTPYKASGENYFVSPSGNNASNGGSFTMNVAGAVSSPIFGSARVGTVSGTAATEYADFKADVYINFSGAEVGIFAEGETYAKCYVAAKQDDTTAHDIDGVFALSFYNTTIPSTAVVSGAAAQRAELYADAAFALDTSSFDLVSSVNANGKVIADGDGDGRLTNSDISVLVRVLSGFDADFDADLDTNGKINNRDAIALIKLLAESEK